VVIVVFHLYICRYCCNQNPQDGAYVNGRAGVFSEELYLSYSIRLGEHMSVYQAEMLRLIHALGGRWSKKEKVIKSMCKTDISSKLLQECVQKLNTCASLNEVTLLSIKGQIDIEGNGAADKLATEGSADIFHGSEPRTAIGAWKIRALVNQWMDSENLKRWKEVSNGIQARKALSCNRRTLSWFTSLITGRGRVYL